MFSVPSEFNDGLVLGAPISDVDMPPSRRMDPKLVDGPAIGGGWDVGIWLYGTDAAKSFEGVGV